MKGETRRYEHSRGTVVAAKREILGKTYLVALFPNDHHGRKTVVVYANTIDGRDDGFPTSFGGMIQPDYDRIVRHKFRDEDESVMIAKAVNEAVTVLEEEIESDNRTEDAVLGALEANAEVHEND